MSDLDLGLLVECLEKQQLSLDLRPITTPADHDVVGFEAQLSSKHPGLVHAGQIVQAAAQFGMIDELATRVSTLAADWLARIPRRVFLIVDLHPLELVDPDGVTRRLAPMKDAGARLVARVPHPGMMLDVPRADETAARIVELGHRLSVGNAGSGFRVLSFASATPPHYIEIEPEIVNQILDQDTVRTMVERIVEWSHERGAAVVAHGADNDALVDVLAGLGVDLVGTAELDITG